MGFDLDSMGRFGFDMDSMRPDLNSISIGLDWIDLLWIGLGPKSGFSLDSIYQSGLDWARSGFDCARLECHRTELDLPIVPNVGAIRVSEAWSQPSLRRLECPRSSQSFKH